MFIHCFAARLTTSLCFSIPDESKIVCFLSPTNKKSHDYVTLFICRGAGNIFHYMNCTPFDNILPLVESISKAFRFSTNVKQFTFSPAQVTKKRVNVDAVFCTCRGAGNRTPATRSQTVYTTIMLHPENSLGDCFR